MLHRVTVIGVGSIGERHVRCILATGRAEVSIVEINGDLRHQVSQRYAVPAFATIDEVLPHGPTAAVVATPAHLHVPLATQLVEAGVHVLIEKPLAVSWDGIDRLQLAVAERQVVAGMAYVLRSYEVLQAMKQAIVEDRFGQLLQFVAVSGQHFPTYRPAYRAIYYASRAAGGGAIQDALTHLVNAGQWLCGPIDRLVADAEHLALPGVSVEDTVHLLARHGPIMASYALNQHQAPHEITLTAICERGTLRAELPLNRLRWMSEPGAAWTDKDYGAIERDTPFTAQANAFLDAVEGTAPLTCSLDEGLQTMRVNLAALASVEEGSWQTINGMQ